MQSIVAAELGAEEAAFYDQYLYAADGGLLGLSNELADAIERQLPAQRRSDAVARRRLIVSNLVANLAALVWSPEKAWISQLAVPTGNAASTRYSRHDFPNGQLRDILKALEEHGAVRRYDYVFKRRATRIEPTTALQRALVGHSAKPMEIARTDGAESIWLLARKDGFQAYRGTIPKERLDYAECDQSRKLRIEMSIINASLKHSGLAYDGVIQPEPFLRRAFTLRHPNDPADFCLNGRLFGGFWQSIPSRDRYRLTLGGQPLADLDYSACFAHLAYIKAGELLPSGDPYDVPGLENHRAAAKTALLSLLSRSTPMKSLSPELKGLLPEGWTAERLVSAMSRKHPRIAPLFGRDVGIDLMFTESQLLVTVLLRLAALGIPALPMHDGLMVEQSETDMVHGLMESASAELLGTKIPVKLKPIWRPTDYLPTNGGCLGVGAYSAVATPQTSSSDTEGTSLCVVV